MNHPCEGIVSPGTVVHVRGITSFKNSCFAVAVPYEFWKQHSTENAITTFNNSSWGDVQIPVFKKRGIEGGWKYSFNQLHSDVIPLFPIERILGDVDPLIYSLFKAFTFRDGSQYYQEVFDDLTCFAKLITGDSPIGDYPGLVHFDQPAIAIREWRLNPPTEFTKSS